jgi:hypothetical protein
MNKVLKNLLLSGAVSLVTAFSSNAQEQTQKSSSVTDSQVKGVRVDPVDKPQVLMIVQNLSAGDTHEFEQVWKPMFRDLRHILSKEYKVDTVGNGFDSIEMMNNPKIDSALTEMGKNSPEYYIYVAGHGKVAKTGMHQFTWEEEKFNTVLQQVDVIDRNLNSVDLFEKVLGYAVKYKKPLKYIFDACAGEEIIEDFYDTYRKMCKEKGVKSLGIDIQLETFSKIGEGHFSNTITNAMKKMPHHLNKYDLKNIYHATNNYIIDNEKVSAAAQRKPTSGSALLHIDKSGNATVLSVDQTMKSRKEKKLKDKEVSKIYKTHRKFFYPKNALEYNKSSIENYIRYMDSMDEATKPLSDQREKLGMMSLLEEPIPFKKFVKRTREFSIKGW